MKFIPLADKNESKIGFLTNHRAFNIEIQSDFTFKPNEA